MKKFAKDLKRGDKIKLEFGIHTVHMATTRMECIGECTTIHFGNVANATIRPATAKFEVVGRDENF